MEREKLNQVFLPLEMLHCVHEEHFYFFFLFSAGPSIEVDISETFQLVIGY